MGKETPDDLVIHARQVHEGVVADPRRYRPVAADLVRSARAARQPEALVLALRALAWAERARLADETAKRLLDEAARLARRHRLDHARAEVLMSRAAVNQELGRMVAAQRDLAAAGRLVAPDRAVELAFNRAILHQNAGRLADAAGLYRELLAGEAPARTRAIAGNNLALIDAQQGGYAAALAGLDEALRWAAQVGPALVAMVLESQAWVTVQAGRLAAGLRRFDQAARAFEEAGLPLGEHYTEYADALMDLRLIPEAMAAARAATEQFRRSGVPLMGAEAQLRVAQLALLSGDPALAEQAARSAVESFRRQRRGAWRARAALVGFEARLRAGTPTTVDLRAARRTAAALEAQGTRSVAVQAHLVAGRIAATLGQTGAVRNLRRAADLARHTPVLVRVRGDLAAALAARLQRRYAEVLARCRSGLGELARYRNALPSVELRALASGHGEELGQIGLEVVVRDGSPRRILDWMERTRAAALLAVEPPGPAEIDADLEELRAVHAELAVASQQPDRGGTPPGPLLAKQLTIEHRIRRATWHRPAVGGRAGAAVRTAPVRELLAGRILVEYGTLGNELLAVVVDRRRSRLVTLGRIDPVLDQVRALNFGLRRLSQARPESSLDAARMSADVRLERLRQLLIRPLGLPPGGELVVVPAGRLHDVGWSALYDGPVSLAPSATFWARTSQAARRDGPVVLVEGPHLPGAAAEVRRLRDRYPQATVIGPPDSTAAAVLRALDGAGLAHLACHGWLRSDNPMFSSLVLSDGPLTVQELESRGVAPHRLILASCQSGAGVAYDGDEVLGFVSALLARGTAGVVASVAAVPDVAAVDLMCALHEYLAQGRTLAHALYAARSTLDRDDPGAYVNWCTFAAHGAA